MFRHFRLYILLLVTILPIFIFTDCISEPKTDTVVTATPVANTVTVGVRVEPRAINPILAPGGNERVVYRHIFNSLLEHDPQQNGALVPFLAKSQPIIKTVEEGAFKGGKSYTYEIREAAKWDDGKSVLASDMVFTFKCIFNPNIRNGWAGALAFVKGIEIDAENPRKIIFYTATCQIKEDESLATSQIYPEHLYDARGLMRDIKIEDLLDEKKRKALKGNENLVEFAKQFQSPDFLKSAAKVSGSGAYKITSFKTKENLVLEKKKDWWGNQFAKTEPIFTANPNKLIYQIVADHETAIAMLKDGELDIRGALPVSSFVDLQESAVGKKKLNFKAPAVPQTYYMVMNTRKAILSDKNVRKAMCHILDLDQYIKDYMSGYAERTVNPYPVTRPYYHKGIEVPQFDLDKAKQYLTSAGWKDTDSDGVLDKKINGVKTDLVISFKAPESSANGKQLGELLVANAKKIGMQIDLVFKEANTIRAEMKADDYDLFVTGIGFTPSRYDDSSLYLHTSGTRNYAHFGNAKTDAILEKIAANCDDDATRNADYRTFQELFNEERPFVMLYQTKERLAINKRLGNVVTGATRPGYFENYFTVKK